MKQIVHLIWVGNKLRDNEIDSARGLVYAALINKATVHFYVDSFSQGSVQSLLDGTMQSNEQVKKHGEIGHYNFLKNTHVRIINIDTDLKPYLQTLFNLPNFRRGIEKLFPKCEQSDLILLLELMVKLELTGAGKNEAATSDLLRAMMLVVQGGFYADLDILLKRTWPKQEFAGNLEMPNHFKINLCETDRSVNNDLIACKIDDPMYVELLMSFIKAYFSYLAADYRFLNKAKSASNSNDKVIDFVSQNYSSIFSIKRILNRYEETHSVTGTNAFSNFVHQKDLFKKEHGFQGTLFSDAQSNSTLSWSKKNKAEDDTRYKYGVKKHSKLETKNTFILFLFNNLDIKQIIAFFINYWLKNDLEKLVQLQKIDSATVSKIISEDIIKLRKGVFINFAAYYNKTANYPRVQDTLKFILGIYRLRITTANEVFNKDANFPLFEIAANIDQQITQKVQDTTEYKVEAGNKINTLIHWSALRGKLADLPIVPGLMAMGLFSSKYGASVFVLMTELQGLGCPIDDAIINKLKANQINAAFRNACYFAKDARILHKFLDFVATLTINVDHKATNGNTPIDCLKNNKHLKDNEKQELLVYIKSLSFQNTKVVI